MIRILGKFSAIGHSTPAPRGSIVIETCSGNDTSEAGDDYNWTWTNPTNRRFEAVYEGAVAVSTEAMWQGTKAFAGELCPDPLTLAGDWKRGKKRRPLGAWGGPGRPLITSAGEARRRIYIPAFRSQIERWLAADPVVADRLARARRDGRPVFLRDWDTGQGLDDAVDEQGRHHGPMSHAWLLCCWLNTGVWPGSEPAPQPRQIAMFGVK